MRYYLQMQDNIGSGRQLRNRWQRCAILFAVAAGFCGLAYFGVNWTRDGGRTSAIWLANAFALGVLLRTGAGLRFPLLATCFLANTAIYTQIGDPLYRILGVALANVTEIFLMLKATSHFCGPAMRFDDFRTLPKFTGLALVITLFVGGPVTIMVAAGTGLAGLEVWGNWVAAHTLGLVIVTPLVAIAIDSLKQARTPDRRDFAEWLLSMGIVLAVTMVIFSQSRVPLLFLASPLVVFAAFRTGLAGTAAAVAIISLVAIIATLADMGPIALVDGELWQSLITLQLFLAVNFLVGLPVASVLQERNAIRVRLAAALASTKSITDNLHVVVFRTDSQGRWAFLNPAWEALTGYPVADWIGKTSNRLIIREDFLAAQSEFARLATGEIGEAVLHQRFRHANGSTRHIDVSIRRLTSEAGAFTGAIGNIRDVTEAVAQQDALTASEDRFRRIAESAPVGVFRANSVGKLTYINAAWATKAGMTVEEMLGDGWLRAIADLSPFVENPAWADFEVGEIRRRAVRFRTAGDELWMEIVTSAEFDSLGEILGFIGVAIDITEQRLAHAELAKRDAELRLLASNATDGIFRLTLAGVCKYASPSAHKLLGLPPNSLIGANMMARFHPDDREEVQAALATLGEGQIDQRLIAYRSERIDAPGQYIWLEANCGLVRDANDTPVEIIASIRNISMRKALEEELYAARNRAEAAVRTRSAFLANMSHEIRTPMNGVIGFSEVLLADDLSASQRRQVELIAESGHAMLRLLNDILDMSKIEAGQMTLAPEPVDFRHVLNGVMRMLRPAAEAKSLTVDVSVADEVPEMVLTDPLRLRQIILNLVSNAIKFTDCGGVRVNAKTIKETTAPQIVIAVEDSGIGMAAERLEAIFAPFIQAEDNIAHRFGGTGLGLSISRDLASLMGGQLSVVSAQGVGSTFTFTLPLIKAHHSHPLVHLSVTPEDIAVDPDIRLLVAEDNDINQQLMRDMADKVGIPIEIAGDGQSAINMVRQAARSGRAYGLVLMDLRMPGMGGLEATQRLRQLGYSPEELPVIALTANAFQDDIDACLAAGMQGHLAKPLRLRDLTEAIHRFGKPLPVNDATKKQLAIGSAPSREDKLNQRYLARKQEVLSHIAVLAAVDGVSSDQVSELAEMLHKLAGTAGAFGEATLGEAAATLEQMLRSARPDQIAAILDKAELLLTGKG